jgi:formate dehydrogenase subunit gamma
MAVYAPWDQDEARTIIAAHAGMAGATLPILHALQNAFGYIHAEAVPLVAAALNLSRADVHGVVSFYHEFRRTPPGRHVLRMCRAEACQSVGAEAVADAARRVLGVDWHGTTENGALTLEPVFCLGLCATGPAALLDGTPLVRLTAEDVGKLAA